MIDLRGSYPPEVQANGYEDAVNGVYTYSSIGRLCAACQLLPFLCMLRALHSRYALLARVRWCRLDKPSIPVSLALSIHCCEASQAFAVSPN